MVKHQFMKTNRLSVAAILLSLAGLTVNALGQGMPPEARKNIHLLLNQHSAVIRTVTMSTNGYVALTESNDPRVASALKEHVRQMEARLNEGLMVRRHDPAFVEFARHYPNLRHTVEPTEKGLRIVVTGKTPEAIKVAQNHATVVTDFATHGWEAHDRDHAPALQSGTPAKESVHAVSSTPKKSCPACCESGAECQAGSPTRTPAAAPKTN